MRDCTVAPAQGSRIIYTIVLFLLPFLSLPGISSGQFSLSDAFPSLPPFSLPVEIVTANDGSGRLFVVQQRGRIYVLSNSSSNPTRNLFLDLSGIVSQSGFETGLLGLAFHPNYGENGYFYVNYTRTTDSLRTYVVRYKVSPSNPDSARTDSSMVLLTQYQPFNNHNGGKILFGPDGYLYISFGDGGSAGDPNNNAQWRGTFLGKILRIDVDVSTGEMNYGIPPSNPFSMTADPTTRGEIFAYGLRNPWKMSFDTQGRLWAGDVGQEVSEEINEILPGRNYGWRIMEGYSCFNPSSECDTTGLTLPLWVYTHPNPTPGSITGGYVYRGTAIPSLTGEYVYGDYSLGNIWAFAVDGPSKGTNRQLLDTDLKISSFGEDTSGNILVASLQTGRILRLEGPATGAEGLEEEIPRTAMLYQNYPNPFNGETRFTLVVSKRERMRLELYDLLGRLVEVLVDDVMSPGVHFVTWHAGDQASGSYLAIMRGERVSVSRKMTFLR